MRYFILIFAILFISEADSNINSQTGKFDIEKVREAATSSDSFYKGESKNLPVEKYNVMALTLRVTIILLLLIIGLLAISWFLRKNTKSKHYGSGAMDIIETLPLGQNRVLTLVRVTDIIYVLAHTSNSIEVVDKIEGQRALDILSSSKGGVSFMTFKEAFNSFMGKFKKSL
ncbi:MAG: flagellar biosynthetic protein FliO [Chitinispirillaceae bacterium]|nr:flagellar biosynthetic protein FliO [Chitinispirillaceae bacterium]